ncbi:MAG: response regulator [Cyanobacteria bacterium P01_A01_bin.114]
MQPTVLLVEDSPTDAAIMIAALQGIGCSEKVQVAQDGAEALNFLAEVTGADEATLPRVILLDLNLPRKTGHEVLNEIKKKPQWQSIPVIVMSSSSASSDIAKSYQLYANAYISKPISLENYELIARRIYDFWLKTVKLPVDFQ